MVAWLAISFVLMVWNAVYCARRSLVDLRGPTPASGVWGLFALGGALSVLGLFAAAFTVSISGV